VSDDGRADRHEVLIQAIDLALSYLDGADLADPGHDEARRERVRDH